jgi:hypothetical protein
MILLKIHVEQDFIFLFIKLLQNVDFTKNVG